MQQEKLSTFSYNLNTQHALYLNVVPLFGFCFYSTQYLCFTIVWASLTCMVPLAWLRGCKNHQNTKQFCCSIFRCLGILAFGFRIITVLPGCTPPGQAFKGSFSWNGWWPPSSSSSFPVGVLPRVFLVFSAAAVALPQASPSCLSEVRWRRVKLKLRAFLGDRASTKVARRSCWDT